MFHRGARSIFGLKRLLTDAVALACAVTAIASCYNPHVVSGRLRCASGSPECPDGFSCVAGLCVSGSGNGAGGAGGMGAAGGAAGGAGGATCANPIVPLCTPAQMTGLCDPVCQTGCPCGQRCEVTAQGLTCAAPTGGLTVGMVCTPEADACAPGLTCLQEACGNDLGRCYRFCHPDSSVCGGAAVCGTPVLLPDRSDSGQRVCDLSGQNCDPYAGTGCVDPALVCYALDPGRNTCDCPSGVKAPLGAACLGYNDCAVGLSCLNVGGAQQCVKLCESAADCPGSTCVIFYGPTLGYCQP